MKLGSRFLELRFILSPGKRSLGPQTGICNVFSCLLRRGSKKDRQVALWLHPSYGFQGDIFRELRSSSRIKGGSEI